MTFWLVGGQEVIQSGETANSRRQSLASDVQRAEAVLGVGELVGVVLAAGEGTRLSPLTKLRPKALCPVNNRPLLDWALDRVSPHCGDIAVNIHYHRDQMLAHVEGNGVHPSVEAPVALGTAGALGRLRDWIAGRPVLVTNADAWELDGATAIRDLLDGWDGSTPRLRCVRSRSRGVFGQLRYVGSALLPWWSVAELDAVPSGLYEVSWQRLQAQGRLDLVVGTGAPIDCGTPRDYLSANLAASGGQPVVGAGAVVEGELVRSVVWPNSRVGPDERLVDTIRAHELTVKVVSVPGEGGMTSL